MSDGIAGDQVGPPGGTGESSEAAMLAMLAAQFIPPIDLPSGWESRPKTTDFERELGKGTVGPYPAFQAVAEVAVERARILWEIANLPSIAVRGRLTLEAWRRASERQNELAKPWVKKFEKCWIQTGKRRDEKGRKVISRRSAIGLVRRRSKDKDKDQEFLLEVWRRYEQREHEEHLRSLAATDAQIESLVKIGKLQPSYLEEFRRRPRQSVRQDLDQVVVSDEFPLFALEFRQFIDEHGSAIKKALSRAKNRRGGKNAAARRKPRGGQSRR
jgi:hypothetical protein